MLVVGEASGDVHGAQRVRALQRRHTQLKFFSVAGEQLQQTHFEPLFGVTQLTGMGLVELAGNVTNLWRAYRLLSDALKQRRPGLLILIDFPEFNLRLARTAKSLGIPVLYYISPQIWAWRQGRVKQIARWVDHMAVVFPFEEEFYARHGVKVSFVGHPLLETVRAQRGREVVLAELGFDPAVPSIALLPGSRRSEIDRHLPVMRQAAVELRAQRHVQFFCVRASTIERGRLEVGLHAPNLVIPIVDENRYDAINAADLVWAASGTATLETALLGRPMIVIYRLSWLTYGVARLLVRVRHIGMVNLIAGERLVPELIQSEARANRLLAETKVLLDQPLLRAAVTDKLAALRTRLGAPGAAERVADIALEMLR